MNRALFSGLSGTVAFQNRLDVVGNNIANSSTVSYKEGRTTFQDALYQTMRGGRGGSDTGLGGMNPVQIGSGVGLSSVTVQQTQGALETTGQPLDASIEGTGMFVLSSGSGVFYSRDGAFALDDRNTLVHAGTGYRVQGWQAVNGEVTPTGSPSDLSFSVGKLTPAVPTASALVTGNLDAAAVDGDEVQTTVSAYDSLGEVHQVTITFAKTANTGEWTATATSGPDSATTTITFDAQGALAGTESIALDLTLTNGATTPQAVAISLGDMTGLTQASNAAVQSQDGRPPASLMSVEITDNGFLEGQFSDGRSETLGQLAVAGFTNPGGLHRIGSNLYAEAPAAGIAAVGGANTGGRGRVVAQTLEMSNVDLTKAFVDMITTQRGFQASTRVIATANEMLDDVIRLVT